MLNNTSPLPAFIDQADECSDLDDAQPISGNIDLVKLSSLLRVKFGAGTYDLQVGTRTWLNDL